MASSGGQALEKGGKSGLTDHEEEHQSRQTTDHEKSAARACRVTVLYAVSWRSHEEDRAPSCLLITHLSGQEYLLLRLANSFDHH
jgi:hypothetical protein